MYAHACICVHVCVLALKFLPTREAFDRLGDTGDKGEGGSLLHMWDTLQNPVSSMGAHS